MGFNASHSMGLILFGGYLAVAHGYFLFQSPFLLVVGLAMLGGLVVLCKAYFFSVPLAGVSISLAGYVASIALLARSKSETRFFNSYQPSERSDNPRFCFGATWALRSG